MSSATMLILVLLMLSLAILLGVRAEKQEGRRLRRTPRRPGVTKTRRKLAGAAGGGR